MFEEMKIKIEVLEEIEHKLDEIIKSADADGKYYLDMMENPEYKEWYKSDYENTEKRRKIAESIKEDFLKKYLK